MLCLMNIKIDNIRYFLYFLVSCKMNNVYGKPGPNSIWATTALGDVYLYDPATLEVS